MDKIIKTIGWNAAAELDNISKFGISFTEASHIFYSEEAAVCNCGNNDGENIIIGDHDISHESIVCRYAEQEGIIRIISARKASNKEKKEYERYRRQKNR